MEKLISFVFTPRSAYRNILFFVVYKAFVESFWCLMWEVSYYAGEGLNLIQLMMLYWRQIILGSVMWWDQCHGVLYSLFGLSPCFCFSLQVHLWIGWQRKEKITLVSELFYALNYVMW